MKSRERILKALKHQETDRIPVDLGSTLSTGMSWVAYQKLKNYLGIEDENFIIDMTLMVSKVDDALAKMAGSDAVGLFFEPMEWKEWSYKNNFFNFNPLKIPGKVLLQTGNEGNIFLLNPAGEKCYKLPAGGYYFDSIYHPLEAVLTMAEINNYQNIFEGCDRPYFLDENFDKMSIRAEKLYRDTDQAVVGNLGLHLYSGVQNHRGFENFLMDLVGNKPLARKMLEKQVEAFIPRVDKYIEKICPFIDVVYLMDDLGMQTGLQISPGIYRQMVKPYHKMLWRYIKEKSGKPLLLHSCGSVYDLIPDLIEMGIDALNPVQVSASNMDSGKLKKEFGRDITFWGGGCDTHKILPFGTTDDVKKEVRKRVSHLSPGGGFVFCQVHNLQGDIPAENMVAMYEELGTWKGNK